MRCRTSRRRRPTITTPVRVPRPDGPRLPAGARRSASPLPAAARQFSRTERLLLRFDAYGPAGTTPAVTLRCSTGWAHRWRRCRPRRASGATFQSRVRACAVAARRLPRRDLGRVDGTRRRAICSDSASPADASSSSVPAARARPSCPCPFGIQRACPVGSVAMSPLVGLLGALGGFTVFYLGAWWTRRQRSASSPSAPPEATSGGVPSPLHLGHRLRHQLLRHARHRIVRADDGDFQVLQDGAGPASFRARSTSGTRCRRSRRRSSTRSSSRSTSTTLILMIVAAVAGAWLGAGIVAGWPKRKIQIGMGFALLVAAALFAWRNLGWRRHARRAPLDLQGIEAGARPGRQLHAGRADDARHRHVRAVHDSGRPARHERRGGVSDHDGLVRVPDADRQRAVRPEAGLLISGRRSAWRSAAFPPSSSPRSSSRAWTSTTCAGWWWSSSSSPPA